MGMNQKKLYRNKEYSAINISILILIAISIILSCWLSQITAEKNVERRVTSESEFLARQQAEIIREVINEHFKKAATLAGMIENGLSFYDKENQDILNTFAEMNNLRMLGYADAKGNVITHTGDEIGNISDDTFFQEIVSGEEKYVCQYLNKTEFGNTPRIIFSTAVHQNEEIAGIVFYSIDTELLKESLFQQSMFEDKESSFIVDKEGNILVRNKRMEENYGSVDKVEDIYKSVEKKFKSSDSGSIICGTDNEEVFSYSAIEQNDWYLICLIDLDAARHTYAANLLAIQKSITVLAVLFVSTIFYFVLLLSMKIKNANKAEQEYKKQYDRVLSLLQKMKCMILEYDVRTKEVKSNTSFEETFGYGIQNEIFYRMPEYKMAHPEFDYDGFVRELNYAIEHKVTTSFETSYCEDNSVYKMLSIVMMPLIHENGQTTNVFLSLRETSDEHLQLKEMTDMFDQIPGGTYRYYLNYPAGLEYAGKNLCKMLGYTVEEFYQKVGSNYYEIIVEKDREKYKKFLKKAAHSPGVNSCQYSMKCKNGEIMDVLDTMESIENSPDIMYGYSVVVDITEYVKRRNIVQQEFVQLEQNLEMMRIQNSASQMQPHFLYNALSSIREVVLIDPQYASDLIYDFTVYLRACIRTMQNGEPIPIQQEINNIRAYVNIEKMRMGKRLEINYDLQSEEFKIVPLSIQPLVENAVRHGIYPKGREGGTITVKTETLKEYNLITVKDNGVGFDYQKVRDEVEKGVRDSIGLDNVMFRLKKQLEASIVIKSKIGEGTVVTVSIRRERESDESDNS